MGASEVDSNKNYDYDPKTSLTFNQLNELNDMNSEQREILESKETGTEHINNLKKLRDIHDIKIKKHSSGLFKIIPSSWKRVHEKLGYEQKFNMDRANALKLAVENEIPKSKREKQKADVQRRKQIAFAILNEQNANKTKSPNKNAKP